jgi:AraC-like DNA-binding protein
LSIIEAGARSAAIAILLLLAVVLLRDGRRLAAARCCGVFAGGTAAVLVAYARPFVIDPATWLLPFRILAFGNPAVFWILATALFDDEFELSWPQITAWLGLVALGFWAVYAPSALRTFAPSNVGSLVCVLLALAQVFAGRSGDLIEARRRMRLAFVAAVGLFTAAVIVAVMLLPGGGGYPALGYGEAFGTLILAFFFSARLLSLRPGAMFETPPPSGSSRTQPESKMSQSSRAAQLDDPRELALLEALRRELEVNRTYREEALSIAALAGRLGAPEYRLRRLINQRLGHRNFSAFLNSYRLDEAIAALGDATQAEVPILTIALDAGFQSVSVFNRAFKARTGVTPTEFRQRRQAEAHGRSSDLA